MENRTIRVRRLGSVTFGISLIALGLLMVINIFIPSFEVIILFRYWPIILIILGIEVLFSSYYKSTEILNPEGELIEQNKVIYDIPAIIMLSLTLLFTFAAALAEWSFTNQIW